MILKISTGFGTSIGAQGKLCGAISGAIMALGLEFGRNEVKKQAKKAYLFAHDDLGRFKSEHGYTTCRELTGCDFDTEEGGKGYEEEKMWERECRQYVASASGITFDLMRKPDQLKMGSLRVISPLRRVWIPLSRLTRKP